MIAVLEKIMITTKEAIDCVKRSCPPNELYYYITYINKYVVELKKEYIKYIKNYRNPA